MARRRRRLSPEERALWAQVAASATALKAEPPSPAPPEVTAPESGPAAAPPARAAPPRRASPRVTFDRAPEPSLVLDRAHPHMDRRRFEKLRRGRLDPEARLDLHGLASDRAHAALTAFILNAHAAGLRLVLVITGKGGPPGEDAAMPQRRGILRHSLPHWLAAPPLVGRILQIAPAHLRHGGTGAFYVYLRRQR